MEIKKYGYRYCGYELGGDFFIKSPILEDMISEKILAIKDGEDFGTCVIGIRFNSKYEKLKNDKFYCLPFGAMSHKNGIYLKELKSNDILLWITVPIAYTNVSNPTVIFKEIEQKDEMYKKRTCFGYHLEDIVLLNGASLYKIVGFINHFYDRDQLNNRIILGCIDKEREHTVRQQLEGCQFDKDCEIEYINCMVGGIVFADHNNIKSIFDARLIDESKFDIAPQEETETPKQWSHYGAKGIEPIEFISKNGYSFCRGNIFKYAHRAGEKKGQEKDDILKIMDYALLTSMLEIPQAHLTREDVINMINKRFDWFEKKKIK